MLAAAMVVAAAAVAMVVVANNLSILALRFFLVFAAAIFTVLVPKNSAAQLFVQEASTVNRIIHRQDLAGKTLASKNYSQFQGRSCDLSRSQFTGSIFSDSTMIGCQAKGSSFRGIKAQRVRWEKNDFSETDFTGANFFESRLTDNDFRGAILDNIIYSRVNFKGAVFNRNTRLPFSVEEAKRRGMIQLDD